MRQPAPPPHWPQRAPNYCSDIRAGCGLDLLASIGFKSRDRKIDRSSPDRRFEGFIEEALTRS